MWPTCCNTGTSIITLERETRLQFHRADHRSTGHAAPLHDPYRNGNDAMDKNKPTKV